MESKTDRVIWYFMVTSMSILIIGGGAWASRVDSNMDKIVGLESNVQHIQSDIKEIKDIVRQYTRGE